MQPDQYGLKFKDHFLDEYKLFVQMADNVSARRAGANQFYVTVLSALLAIVAAISQVFGKEPPGSLQGVAYMAITISGLIVCGVWYINIESYKQLNSGKFKVIHEMEKELPFACYDREWEMLGRGEERDKYIPLTHVERYIPILMAIPFVMVFFAACFSF